MPLESGTDNTERRRARRLPVGREDDAYVHIDLFGRSRWKLKLVEISAIGVGFCLEEGRPSLTIGSRLDGVKLDAVGLGIVGSIRVAHVTRKVGMDTICGVEFAPSTELDRRNLASVIARLEERDRCGG